MKPNVVKSIKKTISWRILSTVSVFCILYAYTGGQFNDSVEIAVAQAIINTALYYVHERIWRKRKIVKTPKVLPTLSSSDE